jgi:hypothetical protein
MLLPFFLAFFSSPFPDETCCAAFAVATGGSSGGLSVRRESCSINRAAIGSSIRLMNCPAAAVGAR